MSKIITKSEQETINLGKKIAKKLHGGEIISLIGQLGSGKTVLIKGIALGLGIKKTITSPTFVILKLYKTHNIKNKIKWLCHVDAYRLNSGKELIDIGIKDWLGKKNSITIIEWGDKVSSILPKKKIVIKLKTSKKQNKRLIYGKKI